MCECAYINKILNMSRVPNVATFRLLQYASVLQCSGYARICLDRVLNIFWILNMLRVAQGSKYATT